MNHFLLSNFNWQFEFVSVGSGLLGRAATAAVNFNTTHLIGKLITIMTSIVVIELLLLAVNDDPHCIYYLSHFHCK